MQAWKEGLNFRDLVMKDADITRRIPRQQIAMAFDLKRQLRNVDKIFARVFRDNGAKPVQPRKSSAPRRRKHR
jgi:adenylosuccinate lyase